MAETLSSINLNQPSQKMGPQEVGVLRVLLIFTLAMIIVPIGAYFGLKRFLFEGFLGYKNGAVGGAIGAVVIVHVIIGAYIWKAIQEERESQRPMKRE